MRTILPKFIALTLPSRGGFDKKAKEISTRELEDDCTRFVGLRKTGTKAFLPVFTRPNLDANRKKRRKKQGYPERVHSRHTPGLGPAWVFSPDSLLWILAFGDFRCRSFGMAADNLIFP
jgi:hypothetical protein